MKVKKQKAEQNTQVTISMKKSMWEEIQERAANEGISASGFLRLIYLKSKKEKTK